MPKRNCEDWLYSYVENLRIIASRMKSIGDGQGISVISCYITRENAGSIGLKVLPTILICT